MRKRLGLARPLWQAPAAAEWGSGGRKMKGDTVRRPDLDGGGRRPESFLQLAASSLVCTPILFSQMPRVARSFDIFL